MASEPRIYELETESEWLSGFPVLNELRTELTKESFLELMNEMRKEGYRLFALETDGQIHAVAGIAIKHNFYYKKHLFVYDLVTSSTSRSKGYGKLLLESMHTFAKEQGAGVVALESGLHRSEAHRFYEEKVGYDRFCYSFKKTV